MKRLYLVDDRGDVIGPIVGSLVRDQEHSRFRNNRVKVMVEEQGHSVMLAFYRDGVWEDDRIQFSLPGCEIRLVDRGNDWHPPCVAADPKGHQFTRHAVINGEVWEFRPPANLDTDTAYVRRFSHTRRSGRLGRCYCEEFENPAYGTVVQGERLFTLPQWTPPFRISYQEEPEPTTV